MQYVPGYPRLPDQENNMQDIHNSRDDREILDSQKLQYGHTEDGRPMGVLLHLLHT